MCIRDRPAPDAMVLDCGCGGGANIKTLLKLCPNGKVQGIDYSAVSVEKARKVNARAIAAGRCTVQQASVAELPFKAEQFDVVTAFETGYFWPELAQNFREVYRVLKQRCIRDRLLSWQRPCGTGASRNWNA